VPEGDELRTAEGRAEVLLTPDVFVRIGQRTTIRMVANKLSDTRVELLAGSAVVDSAEPGSGTAVTLIHRNWNVRFFERGVYRIDSDPPRLWVLQGKAEVSANPMGPGLYSTYSSLGPDQPGFTGLPGPVGQWSHFGQRRHFGQNRPWWNRMNEWPLRRQR
jgi:hypothetical protein